MLSFSKLALLALPLFGSVIAEEAAVPTKSVDQTSSIYSNAQEAFRDLLNALPEESLHAALSGLKDFQSGVFESHHRGVEQVHNNNPALATKLIVAAVQDLKKRQTPSNGTTTAAPPPPQSSPQNSPPPASSPAPNSPTTNNLPPASPTTSATDRAVIVNVPQTTTNSQGQTIIQTTSVLSQVTASIPVTLTRTTNGAVITTTENRPAVIRTTTDSAGRAATVTSAAQFAPTAGEVRTETNAQGSTFVTTYTPGGGKISSVKILTTTDEQGRVGTVTSYTFVDPQQTQAGEGEASKTQTGKPGLQTGAAVANKQFALGYAAAAGGLLAVFV